MTEVVRGAWLPCALLFALGCPKSDADKANEILEQAAAQQSGPFDEIADDPKRPVQTASGKLPVPLQAKPVERLPYAGFSWVSGGDAVAFSRDADQSEASSVWILPVEGDAKRATPISDRTAVALRLDGDRLSFIELPPYERGAETTPDNRLMELPIGGGKPKEVGLIGESRMVLHVGAWRYVALGGGVSVGSGPSRLEAWPQAGGEPLEVAPRRNDTVRSLVAFDGALFWTSHDQSGRSLGHAEGHLWRVELDDAGKPVGVAGSPVYTSLDRPEYLAVLNGALYLLSGGEPKTGFRGSLSRVDAQGKNVTPLVRGVQLPDALVATKRHLCWKGGSMQRWKIQCYQPDEDRIVDLHEQSSDGALSNIAALGSSLVWSQGYAHEKTGRTFVASLP